MHTYTIITISDYHNIDHNCMRPGGFKISEGLGAWRRCLIKMGFVFLFSRSKLSDTFLWGGSEKKGESRSKGSSKAGMHMP